MVDGEERWGEGGETDGLMQTLKGIAVSPGLVIGRVFVLDDVRRRVPRRVVESSLVPGELARLRTAIAASVGELELQRVQTQEELGEEAAKVFHFHLGMLRDRSLVEPMEALIRDDHVTADFAAWKSFKDLESRFASFGDTAFSTKTDDVRDMGARVLRHLLGGSRDRMAELVRHDAVVIARDLTPTQTAGFDRGAVKAFATDLGGKTSHTAIFARALGMPAVVGLSDVTERVSDAMPVIIDGDRGVVILDPDDATLERYAELSRAREVERLELLELDEQPCVTTDGVEIELLGNIEFPEEIPGLLAHGAMGVGLYRTEFLYLTSTTTPTEEDHFRAYRRAVELLEGRTLVIRTVDLGADKYTQEQHEQPERNPFLGLRSIRYCLQSLPMFKTQLRAILRASSYGPMKVMFPLVSSTQEFRQARYLLNDVMEDLEEEGVAFDRKIPIGMMVEVPSAALMADVFAREAAFFSIGTNDLVQYTLAVDRTNERVAHLYNPSHPAVISLILETVRAARKHGIPVSCCGESSADPESALLLIGLGLRTLSVTSGAIPVLKRLIRGVSMLQCERLARKARTLDSDVAITAFLRDQVRKLIPEPLGGWSAGAFE